MSLYQIKKLLSTKGNNKQNEKATYGMGKTICEPHIWLGVNIQNM